MLPASAMHDGSPESVLWMVTHVSAPLGCLTQCATQGHLSSLRAFEPAHQKLTHNKLHFFPTTFRGARNVEVSRDQKMNCR